MEKLKIVDLYNHPFRNLFTAFKGLVIVFMALFIIGYFTMLFQGNDFLTNVAPPIFAILILALLVWWFIRYYKKRDLRFIRKRIEYFIRANNLFIEETVDKGKDSNGKAIKEKQVTYSVRIGYMVFYPYIEVHCLKDGSKISSKLSDLGSEFEALFGLELDDVKDDVNEVVYIFDLEEDQRLNVEKSGVKTIQTENGISQIYDNKLGSLTLSSGLDWDYSKVPHALIAGNTGGGKTFFINYLIMEFLKDDAEVFICDAKMSDLYALNRVMPEKHVASSSGQIARVMRLANEVMEERYQTYIDGDKFVYGYDYLDHGLKPVVVFFDEIGAFKAITEKSVAEEVEAYMKNIILKGRQMGVFMVLSTQQPNADNIPTEIRDMMGLRVTLGNMSNEGYRMVYGQNYDLKSVEGKGHGYIYVDGQGWEVPKRYSAPFIDKYNVDLLTEISELVSRQDEHVIS